MCRKACRFESDPEHQIIWVVISVGREPRLHRGCRRFEPVTTHQIYKDKKMTVDILIFTGNGNPVWQRAIGPTRIATELRNHGYSVQVVDELSTMLQENHDTFKKIIDKFVGPNTLWVGFSSTFLVNKQPANFKQKWVSSPATRALMTRSDDSLPTYREQLHDIRQTILDKNPKCKLVLGGSKANLRDWEIIDIYVEGYADTSAVKMTRWIEGKNPFFQVVSNNDGRSVSVVDDPKASHFDFVNSDTRWHPSDKIFQGESLPIEISRGCIFNCSFCSYPLNGKKKMDYLRDPQLLRDEFIRNYEEYGTTGYVYCDDTHNDSADKLEILYDQVYSKLNFKINFVAYLRLDLLAAKPHTAQLLLDSGLQGAFFGIESLNYESARSVGKGIRPERAIETLHSLKQLWGDRVMTSAGFISGLPYDTEETIGRWGDMISDANFPIDTVTSSPLTLSKNGGKSLWKSEFDLNPGKYGYYFPDDDRPSYWENSITGLNFNRAIEIANSIDARAKQNKAGLAVLFVIPALLSMGYKFENIKHGPKSLFSDLHCRHEQMCKEYFERLLK